MTANPLFAGRVIAVFGGSSPLGAACAAHFASAGADVVVQQAERRPAQLVTDTVERFGRLDAAILLTSRSELIADRDGWPQRGEVVGQFLTHEIEAAGTALAEFDRAGHGRLILATSSVGAFGHPAQPLLAAVDGAMIGLARSLALAGRSADVRVNAIATIVDVEPYSTVLLREGCVEAADFGAEHVLPMIAYLAHDDCRLNGSVLTAGGGRYARVSSTTSAGIFDSRADMARIAAAIEGITRTSYPVEPRCATDELFLIDV
jgi:NAD(P)-dependent dehydrogenase (short-subunit alcohol dehydrogenase family)